ncbi:hypothetical protein [Ornithinimicrobium kibberense]|uniref:hypothetical protein n=1 Tax=Ornithinimicrobium kibberense TaxID=282060 RepID=UPI0036141E1C
MAASAGLVGLAGFVVLWVGTLVVLFRMDAAFGTLALALALSRIAVAQFDLFWVSISVSVPFLLIGVCLGVGHGHGVRGTASKQSDAVGVGG